MATAKKKPAAKPTKKPSGASLELDLAGIEKRLANLEKRIALAAKAQPKAKPAPATDPRIAALSTRYRDVWGITDPVRLATLIARHLVAEADRGRR